ncbi:MAG: hypothetical protein NTZ08_00490, partial [Verrucomicrobia bacterium]|nr:hypothetical protein [Verrucomicrobiota bacterium]
SMTAVLSETTRVIKSMTAVLSETTRVIKSMTAVLSETTPIRSLNSSFGCFDASLRTIFFTASLAISNAPGVNTFQSGSEVFAEMLN